MVGMELEVWAPHQVRGIGMGAGAWGPSPPAFAGAGSSRLPEGEGIRRWASESGALEEGSFEDASVGPEDELAFFSTLDDEGLAAKVAGGSFLAP